MITDSDILEDGKPQPKAAAGSPVKPVVPTLKVKKSKKTVSKKGTVAKSALGVLSGVTP